MTDPKLQTTADLAQQLRDVIPPAPHFLAMLEELERRAESPVDREKALDSVGDIASGLRRLEEALHPEMVTQPFGRDFQQHLRKQIEKLGAPLRPGAVIPIDYIYEDGRWFSR